MIYDTLKLAEQLEHEAGLDAPRARAMARIFAENASGNLATREDLLALREEILVVKGQLEAAIQAVRSEVSTKIGVLYWMAGTTLAGLATLLGADITIALHAMHLG